MDMLWEVKVELAFTEIGISIGVEQNFCGVLLVLKSKRVLGQSERDVLAPAALECVRFERVTFTPKILVSLVTVMRHEFVPGVALARVAVDVLLGHVEMANSNWTSV